MRKATTKIENKRMWTVDRIITINMKERIKDKTTEEIKIIIIIDSVIITTNKIKILEIKEIITNKIDKNKIMMGMYKRVYNKLNKFKNI